MKTIDDRLTAAVEELQRSLDTVPETGFRPAVTRVVNVAIAVVGALVVLALIAIPAWLTRGTNTDVTVPPATSSAPSTTAAPETMKATLVAELGDLSLMSPVVLDDGTIVARAWLTTDLTEPSQPGFARSSDDGATWTFDPTDEEILTSPPSVALVDDVVVALGSGGALVSRDGGETWTVADLTPPEDFVELGFRGGAIAVDGADRFVVYWGNGKWVSNDGLSWEGSIQDNSYRSLSWDPQIIGDVLVAVGEDDRIYNMVPGQALEVSLEGVAEQVFLTAGNGTVLARGKPLSDSGGTWLGTTADGLTWSEHKSDLSFADIVVLSEVLGGGYLGVAAEPETGVATAYRSPDLEAWTAVARIDGGTVPSQLVEVEGGVLAIAWGSAQQIVWFVELDAR